MGVVGSLFSSDRERRLWLWTGALMVAIYSSLGIARAVTDELRERNLLRASIAVFVVVAVGAIAWRWVQERPDRGEVGAALAVAFGYWVVALRVDSVELRSEPTSSSTVSSPPSSIWPCWNGRATAGGCGIRRP